MSKLEPKYFTDEEIRLMHKPINKEAVLKAIDDLGKAIEDSKKLNVNKDFFNNLRAVLEQFEYHLGTQRQIKQTYIEPTFAEFIQFMKEATNEQ